MQFPNIEGYISKFEELYCKAGYTQGNEETINLFLGGLVGKILVDVLKPPFAHNYNNIKIKAIESTQACVILDVLLGAQQDLTSNHNPGI
jgi:hypothetical protein